MNPYLELKTKLPKNENLVPRKELFDFIDQSINNDNKVLLVSAPAGYGKTTLVSEWINKYKNSTVWYTLKEDDNDLETFIEGIVFGFKTIDQSFFKNTYELIKIPSKVGDSSLLSTFLQDLKMIDKNIFLVLDDYHIISNKKIDDFLDKLIRLLPTNIKFILLTREDPQLPLHKYRIENMLYEIRANKLKFDIKEIEKFFKYSNIIIDDNEINLLLDKTEGWISGLNLAKIILKDKDPEMIKQFIYNFSGTNHYIIDYLIEEVLDELDEKTKSFLYKTSITERISPDLCDYLSGQTNSFEILNRLMKMNLFITEIDSNQHWYRYHQLFKDYLTFNLSKEERISLHLKASNWYAENGYYQDAVSEAIEAKDFKLAVKHIDNAIYELLKKGEIKTLLHMLDKIPDNYILESTTILIIKAWTLFATGNKGEALYYIQLVNENISSIDKINKGRLYTLTSLIPQINNNPDPTIMAKKAVELIEDEDYIFKINAWMSLGQIEASIGKVNKSIKSFKNAYHLGKRSGQRFLEVISLINLVLKLNMQGSLQTGYQLTIDYISRNQNKNQRMDPITKLMYIPLGVLLFQMGKYKEAREKLIVGVEISEQLDLVHVSWLPKVYYAQSVFYSGEVNESFEILDDLLNFTKRYNLKANQEWVEAIKEELSIKHKETNPDSNIFKKYEDIENKAIDYNYFRRYFNYIRFLILTNDFKKARMLLENKEDYLNNSYNEYTDKLRYALFISLVNLHENINKKTKGLFLKTINDIKEQKYFGIIIEEIDFIKPFLDIIKKENVNLHKKVNDLTNLVLKSRTNLIEDLTERELDIIKLVAKGYTNKKIADELYITVGTTKWHLSNIYSKILVKNRTEAILKAKQLKILD
ncbi:MAG: LuxR C-terminal-related transcriptional regulator [Bacillota bacterium]